MRHVLLALLTGVSLAASAPVAVGQTSRPPAPAFALPPESITVTATKPSPETIESYVDTRAKPTYVLGRMARWTRGVCPVTIGLGDKYAKYITQRIKNVAGAVGAPVNTDPGCRSNVQVMFTLNPHVLMDNVRKDQPTLLGFHHNDREADELAKVTHSIQGWYATVSQDTGGATYLDEGTCGTERGSRLHNYGTLFPCAVVLHVTGSRAVDGLDSGFFNIIIVADPSKLADYEIGTLGDYIAMMALSQPASLDSCQELPSISNLLTKGCKAIPSWITDGDLAFLKGLYATPSGYSMTAQRSEMQYQMKKTLVTDKGG